MSIITDLLESLLVVWLDRLAISEVRFHMWTVVDDSFPHFPGHWCFMQQVVVGVDWAVHEVKKLVAGALPIQVAGDVMVNFLKCGHC